MINFLISQQDYIHFFYGMSLIILAAACFVVKRQEEDFIPWPYLALHSLLFGSHELLHIIAPLLDISILHDDILDYLLIFTSYLFILEFGRLGISRLKKKVPGRWIYVPLLAVIVLGGITIGWHEVLAASRYIIALPGRFLAAVILLFFAMSKRAFPRYLLMTGSFLMALYALTVTTLVDITYFVVPPSNDLRALPRQDLSGPLIRGSLVLGMALAISLYSQISFHAADALDHFKKRSRYFLGISVLAMLFILAVGWVVTQHFGNRARSELESTTESLTDILEGQITSLMVSADQEVKAISKSPEILQTLTSGGGDTKKATATLNDAKWLHGVEICYLLDVKGKVIAASDGNKPGIIGQDFSRHPYMARSLYGEPGSYIAFGLATEKRGYFSSYPVFNDKIEVVGAAVIKKNLDALETDFADHKGFVFLVNREGIILLSSRPKMVLMNLWPSERKIKWETIAPGHADADRAKALLPAEPDSHQLVSFERKRYLATSHAIVKYGWTIVLLSPTDEIGFYRLFGIIIALSICILAIIFFVGMEKSMEAAANVALSENRFRVVFEGAPTAIFIISRNTQHILSVNSFMTDWLGYAEDELLALTLDDIRVGEVKAEGECKYRKRDGTIMFVEETREIMSFHGQAAELIIIHDISEHKKKAELLYELSMSDGLTGIANRRRFDQFLDQEWRRAMREGAPVSLIMCDIDFFKRYNDTYGHLAGDDCLRQVASLLGDMLRRPGDMVARYGGEEFAVIMPGTVLEGALLVAEAARNRMLAKGIPHTGSSVNPVVTLSMGVASVIPAQGSSHAVLIAVADNALYRAKSEGRNCVRS